MADRIKQRNLRIWKDRWGGFSSYFLSAIVSLLILFLIAGLMIRSFPLLEHHSISHLLLNSHWKPGENSFGFLPFIISSIEVTLIASLIAVPLCVFSTIYLSEYASKRIRDWVMPLMDILAAIPSVIYGIWGVLVIVPFIRDYVAPAFGYDSNGYSVLAGGLVLSIMIFPVVIHVFYEVLRSIPNDLREAGYSLGLNRWEVVRHLLLRRASAGLMAALILGISKAFGETLAVLMVVGNVPEIPKNLFSAGYPLPALIANNYGEMMSIPLYDSALMFSALLLLVVVMGFNIVSRLLLIRIQKNMGL